MNNKINYKILYKTISDFYWREFSSDITDEKLANNFAFELFNQENVEKVRVVEVVSVFKEKQSLKKGA